MRTFIKRALVSLLAFAAIATTASAQDMTSTPLTLEATSEGDITFLISYSYSHSVVLTPVEYKINDGSWTAYASWPADAASITSSTGNWPVSFGDAIHVTAGDKVSFRGDNASYYGNGTGYECHITSTADVYVYGNMMSLVDADDFSTLATLTGDWNFAKLFKLPTVNLWDPPVTVTTIKSHPTYDIVLPATTLTNYCYNGLFAGCSGITRAPKLPATTMKIGCYAEMFRATSIVEAPALPTTVFQPYSYDAEGEHGSIDCYMQMFQDCTDLTVAPVLPATTLVHGVYQNMFEGCTSLTTAPALPATDLTGGDQCYTAMFKGCTSLVTAPALPATTLDNWCYMEMFSGCTSLVNAPELPATTLAEDCYHRMFEGCISLQKAPVLPAPTLLGQVYGGMFDGCTSLNYVKCLAVDIVDTSHGEDATTDCWLANVSATGTFIKADEADWSVKTKTGEAINGIPAGWTVKNVVALADDADNSTALTTYQSAANDVTLSGRTLYRNGEWNTLCLPFDVPSLVGTPLEGATIRPLTNAALTSTALTLTFGAAVNAITAGIPYIVKWATTADNLTNPTFEDVTISSTTPSVTSFGTGNSQVQFIGTYGPETLVKDDPTNRYLGSGNKLYYPTVEGFKVNAFRAYFKLGALAASAPMVNLVIDETTSISDATRQNHQTNSAWYTLDGRQLTTKPMTKGVYIHNGKKEVVK